MGWYADDHEEKKWANIDPHPYNRYSDPNYGKSSGISPTISTSGGNPVGGIVDLLSLVGMILSGSYHVVWKLCLPLRIVWLASTLIINTVLIFSAIGEKATWQADSIFATIVTFIMFFLVVGVALLVPAAIIEYVLIRPVRWIFRKVSGY